MVSEKEKEFLDAILEDIEILPEELQFMARLVIGEREIEERKDAPVKLITAFYDWKRMYYRGGSFNEPVPVEYEDALVKAFEVWKRSINYADRKLAGRLQGSSNSGDS